MNSCPELKAEGFSRCTFEITADGDVARLEIAHEIDSQPSKFVEAVSTGWPMILSSLKTLLETGASLVAAAL